MKRNEKAVREENDCSSKQSKTTDSLQPVAVQCRSGGANILSLHAIAQEVTVILTRNGTQADVERVFEEQNY